MRQYTIELKRKETISNSRSLAQDDRNGGVSNNETVEFGKSGLI